MVRRPPPRKRKKPAKKAAKVEKTEPMVAVESRPTKDDPKTVFVLGKENGREMVKQLDEIRNTYEDAEQRRWDRTPLGKLYMLMVGEL